MSKAERTKSFIIEKTAPIFNTKGFAGTSLNDMTAATGLTKGSIYGNFANKDEVALAVFDFNLQKLKMATSRAIARETGARAKLLAYAGCYEGTLFPPFTTGGCPILNTAVESDDTHPALREKAANALISWKNSIVELINEGKATKEFSAAINAEQFALTMVATLEGAIMISRTLGDIQILQTIVQSLKRTIEELK